MPKIYKRNECVRCSNCSQIIDISQELIKANAKGYEEGQKGCVRMGDISSWVNWGKKNDYWDYFIKIAFRTLMDRMKKKYLADDNYHKFFIELCSQISSILKK